MPGCPVIVGPDSSRVATLVSEIISRSIPSGRSRSHALRCHRHALIMQMSLGLLLRAAVNERCTCIRVPSSGETSGVYARGHDTRARTCTPLSRPRPCPRRPRRRREINFSSGQRSQFSSCSWKLPLRDGSATREISGLFRSTKLGHVLIFFHSTRHLHR